MATTMESVTREQIEQLAREAGEAGDLAQVRLCRAALAGMTIRRPANWSLSEEAESVDALRACVRAIQSAEAMVDEPVRSSIDSVGLLGDR